MGNQCPYGSVDAAKTSGSLIGSIVFTPYDQDILVWRRGSSGPILDAGPGGRVRDVPLQAPSGLVFVDMVSANDRWVAQFRIKGASEDSPSPGVPIPTTSYALSTQAFPRSSW